MSVPRQTATHVPTSRLLAHPANIRDDLGDLTELAASIREQGILQPLTATELPDDPSQLLLLAGHRRLRAAQMAGCERVPVIIRHEVHDPVDQMAVMLIENTHRKSLNPVERAQAYGAMRNRGLTLSEVARRTGTQPSVVSYYLSLLDLDEESLEAVRRGHLKSSSAIAAVRASRQERRETNGKPVRGRPRGGGTWTQGWFGTNHRLAGAVRQRCDHRERPQVGGLGCGPCWEQAIIADSAEAVA